MQMLACLALLAVCCVSASQVKPATWGSLLADSAKSVSPLRGLKTSVPRTNARMSGVGQQRRLLAEEVDDSDRDEAASFAESERDTPRYVFFSNGGSIATIEPGLCAKDDEGVCRWSMYVESVFLVTFLSFVMAACMCCACPCFWICRAKCCGGCSASDGLLCPGDTFKNTGSFYSDREVLVVKILTVVLGFIAIIFAVVGFVGSDRFSESSAAFGDSLVETSEKFLEDLHAINQEVQGIVQASSANASDAPNFAFATADVQQMVDQAKDVRDWINDADAIRHPLIVIAMVLSLFLFVLLLLAAGLNLQKLAYAMMIFGFVLSAIMWVIFSVHKPLSIMFADVCFEIDDAITRQQENRTKPGEPSDTPANVLDILLGCAELPNFVAMRQSVDDAVNASGQVGCDVAENIVCASRTWCPGAITNPSNTDCPGADCSGMPAVCSFLTLPSYKTATVADYQLGCWINQTNSTHYYTPPDRCGLVSTPLALCAAWTNEDNVESPPAVCSNPLWFVEVQSCANLCASPTPAPVDCCNAIGSQNLSANLMRNIVAVERFQKLKRERLDPFLRCQPLTDLFLEIQSILCIQFLNSLSMISAASIGLGVLFLPSIVLAAMGSKRFNVQNQEEWLNGAEMYY